VTPARHLTVALDVLPLAGSPTGVGMSCDQLLRALVARPDVTVKAFAVARRASTLRDRLPAGVPFRAVPVPARAVQAAWRHLNLPSAELVAGPASVVHGTNFVVPPPRNMATVVTVNDATPWKYPELCAPASRGYPPLVLRAVSRGAFVHTASHFVAAELAALIGVELGSIRVIPYGPPPTATVEPADKALAEPPYVLAIGTVEPRKDYPRLVEAFAEVGREHPSLRLVIAGAEGWGTQALDRAVARWGDADRIVRLGYVDDDRRASLLAGARVLAYPSIYEGFGFPPLEAMAAGVPVVATAGGAVPEVAGDGALIVPVGDTAALAAALGRVLSDDDLRHDLVNRGRRRVAEYSWAATAEAMLGLYSDAARAAGSGA
jgi:glycosyltransferase involved in cell wall biosynthesis